MSYPWIKDSQYGSTPLITNYLQVTSPNGLYLNDTNSEVLLSNSPTTSEKLTINNSSIDFVNTNGNSALLIDNTKIHLNEPSPTPTPTTTDITYQNIILQSQNLGTPTYTLTLRPNVIQHLTPNFTMLMGTGTYHTQALSVPRTSSLNPYVFSLGFDGGTYQGKLYCLNIDCATNLNVLTINGLSSFPITTGLIWADFANPYSSLPSNRYYLTDTTFETYQDLQQFYARNMSGNQSASYNWNGINTTGATFTLQTNKTNGYNFDLYCSTFKINGIPYSPGGGGGSQDLSTTLSYGSTASTSINMNGQNIDSVNNINLSTINGFSYPPYPTGSYGLSTVLAIDNNAASTSINMNGQDINSVNNINVASINGSSYPPSVSIPQFIFAMPFQFNYINNGTPTVFGTPVFITSGTYAITWTFWYDGLYQSAGDKQMIEGFGDLYSNSYGSITGHARMTGIYPSSYVSTNNMYRTSLTYTDNNYVIINSDNYLPNIYQTNIMGWSGNTYVSATISRTN